MKIPENEFWLLPENHYSSEVHPLAQFLTAKISAAPRVGNIVRISPEDWQALRYFIAQRRTEREPAPGPSPDAERHVSALATLSSKLGK